VSKEEIQKNASNSWVPQFPTNLPGSFWGITTFFNPCHYRIRIDNYKRFRESSKRQGLKLICVELAFGKSAYELKEDDAEIMVRVRTKNVLWQKERLLNIGLKHLPPDCDKILWLDADILFFNDRWIEQASQLLNAYIALQPFSCAILLPAYVDQIGNQQWPDGVTEGHKINSFAYEYSSSNTKPSLANLKYGHPGLAWAARRSLFDDHSFYDRFILGGSDSLMAYAFFGERCPYYHKDDFSKSMILNQEQWIQKIGPRVCGSVYYVQGNIAHLWHGNNKDRFYINRDRWLKKYNFDPETDIQFDENGCWSWATPKRMLHLFCRSYFFLRNEEGSIMGIFLVCIFNWLRHFHHFFKNSKADL
jgi:hypothetical protein